MSRCCAIAAARNAAAAKRTCAQNVEVVVHVLSSHTAVHNNRVANGAHNVALARGRRLATHFRLAPAHSLWVKDVHSYVGNGVGPSAATAKHIETTLDHGRMMQRAW